MQEKKCRNCNETKEVSLFARNKTKKDGYDTQCKKCKAAINKARRDADPQLAKEKRRAWIEKNKDKIGLIEKRYYEKIKNTPEYREKIRASSLKYYHKNKVGNPEYRDRRNVAALNYYYRNRETILQKKKERYAEKIRTTNSAADN